MPFQETTYLRYAISFITEIPRNEMPTIMNETEMSTLHYGQRVFVTMIVNNVPIQTNWMYVAKNYFSTEKENICVSSKLGGRPIYEVEARRVHIDRKSAILWVIHEHERLEKATIRTDEANIQFLASARHTSLKSLGISAREELEAIEMIS